MRAIAAPALVGERVPADVMQLVIGSGRDKKLDDFSNLRRLSLLVSHRRDLIRISHARARPKGPVEIIEDEPAVRAQETIHK